MAACYEFGKQAYLGLTGASALGGAAIGGLRAPKKKKLEGAGRGAFIGIPTGLGAGLGGGVGAVGGATLGGGLGAGLGLLAVRQLLRSDHGLNDDKLKQLAGILAGGSTAAGLGLGAGAGGLAGAGAGGYGGFHLGRAILGKPSWEKDDEELKASDQEETKQAFEKVAVPVIWPTGALVGGTIGGFRAPKGKKLEGAGRGAIIGAPTSLGGVIGGLAGGYGGAALGGGLGTGLGMLLASKFLASKHGLSPEEAAQVVEAMTAGTVGLGVGAGATGGGLLGAGAGAYGGFNLGKAVLGKPSWEQDNEELKASDQEETKQANAFTQTAGAMFPATAPLMGVASTVGNTLGNAFGMTNKKPEQPPAGPQPGKPPASQPPVGQPPAAPKPAPVAPAAPAAPAAAKPQPPAAPQQGPTGWDPLDRETLMGYDDAQLKRYYELEDRRHNQQFQQQQMQQWQQQQSMHQRGQMLGRINAMRQAGVPEEAIREIAESEGMGNFIPKPKPNQAQIANSMFDALGGDRTRFNEAMQNPIINRMLDEGASVEDITRLAQRLHPERTWSNWWSS